jgi:uncharacterized protein
MGMDLREFGPWAVVTGASSGIGEGFAHALARQGFNLVLVARRGQVLNELAGRLREAHSIDCRPVTLDLAEPTFLDSLRRTTDGVDVGLLISNAGTATANELVRWDGRVLERDLAVNTTAHLKLAHHFGGRLASRRKGGILLVSSIAGLQPIPYLASYSASKSFVTVLGESLHAELRPLGVTVTVLIAGPTDTPMRTAMGFGRSRFHPLSPAECAAEGLNALAAGRPTRIPGRRTRLLLKLVPRRVISRILGRMAEQFSLGSAIGRPAPALASGTPNTSGKARSTLQDVQTGTKP